MLLLKSPEYVEPFFAELESLIRDFYVAGFFSYELGYCFEEVFTYSKETDFPLAFFCAYENPAIYDHIRNKFISGSFSFPDESREYTINNVKLSVSDKEYENNIRKIQEYIASGDIYQANYTLKCTFDFHGSPLGLYNDLKQKQHVAYNVFARIGDYNILSLSPELFFHKKGNRIEVKPMKGTMKRGRTLIEDRNYKTLLGNDGKNQSENVMIVDLLRNDLGRISGYGSVVVKKLYEVEKYDTLFQMTSTIQSKLRRNISLYELFKSIYPSGSVTGTPKIRSMEIIRELEKEERNIYTGAIGFFRPGGEAKFNVAIRTILLRNNKGEMGIGSGVIADSVSSDEFDECSLKARFLLDKPVPDFCLIETILFEKGFKYLALHLKRLRDSAEYFNFRYKRAEIISQLNGVKKFLTKDRYKIRILLDKSCKISLHYMELGEKQNEYTITISEHRTDSGDPFFYHKTTNRGLYEREFERARHNGFFDILFFNEKGEATEGAITNLFIMKDGVFFTPPVECGLLPGTMRSVVMKKFSIRELSITENDLLNADELYISNSIIGFQKARLHVPDHLRKIITR